MKQGTIWKRWNVLSETIITIPKFKSIWSKTNGFHPDKKFRELIDSLLVQKQNQEFEEIVYIIL